MTVKETVRRMLIQYPSLFADKADCFNHLFLTLGCGYDWQDGGLIDQFKDPNNDAPVWADESGDDPRASRDESPELTKLLRPMRILHARRDNNRVRFALENFDAMFDEYLHIQQPYPVCDLCHLFTMPADVQPEWRIACDETSHALAMWLHQQKQFYSADRMEQMSRLNKQFRQTHFAEKDAYMTTLLKEVLGEEKK